MKKRCKIRNQITKGSNMLKSFDEAFKNFESNVYCKLHKYYFNSSTALKDFNIQLQAQSLANDVGYSAMIIRDLYVSAVEYASKEFDNHIRSKSKGFPNTISTEVKKLGVSFKSFFFSIRAYQDSLYKIILGIEGQSNGRKSSMKNAIDYSNNNFNRSNPAGSLLALKCPDYANWFIALKENRDQLKYGMAVSYNAGKNFETGETNVAIEMKVPNKKKSFPVGLDFITKSLAISAKATNGVIESGLLKNKLTKLLYK